MGVGGGGCSWAAGGASGRRNLVRRCERGGRFRTWDVIIDAIVPALCEVRPPRVPVLMIRGSYRPTTPPPGPRLPLCDGRVGETGFVLLGMSFTTGMACLLVFLEWE